VAQAVPRVPVARRDLAVVVDEGVTAGALLDALAGAAVPHVERIVPFDVYRGPGLPSGKKSVAILVLMQDTARTLTDNEIDGALADLLGVLEKRFGATLRK